MLPLTIFMVNIRASAPVANECPVECRIEYTAGCPENCTTLNDILTNKNSKDDYSPMDIADVIRKTYENAENNKANYTGIPSPVLDENGNLKKDPLDNTPNTKSNYSPSNNALIPSAFNPIDPNNSNPSQNSSNGNESYNPGGIGDNLLPPSTNPNDLNNWMPNGPKTPTHNDPHNILDTAPTGNVPSNPAPPVSRTQIPIATQPVIVRTAVQTVVSYVPQVTTVTHTSPPVVIEKPPKTETLVKSVTSTQPPVYVRIPPQTYVQTLPARTVTSYKHDTITQVKTFVQPVELPRETLTSYAPVVTKTEEKRVTSVVQLPPCTKTILSTVTLPATTVFVVKTRAVPTEMNIHLADSTVSPSVQAYVPITPGTSQVSLPNMTYVNTSNGVVPVFSVSGKNINEPFMLDVKELEGFCRDNSKNKLCMTVNNSGCVPSKINICYGNMLKSSYNQPVPISKNVKNIACEKGNVKLCEVSLNKTPSSKISNAVSNFYKNMNGKNRSLLKESDENPTISSKSNVGSIGLLSKLKSLLKKKEDKSKLLETDIGEAYNEKAGNKVLLLSDILNKEEN